MILIKLLQLNFFIQSEFFYSKFSKILQILRAVGSGFGFSRTVQSSLRFVQQTHARPDGIIRGHDRGRSLCKLQRLDDRNRRRLFHRRRVGCDIQIIQFPNPSWKDRKSDERDSHARGDAAMLVR